MESKKVKTLKISELIKILQVYKRDLGDLYVIHSTDSECNSYNTISEQSLSYMKTDTLGNVFLICPWEENIDGDLFNLYE